MATPPNPPPTRGTLIAKVNTVGLYGLLTGRRALRLPPDAELISWWRDTLYERGGEGRIESEWICLKLEHTSFPVPPPGTRYAELEPELIEPESMRPPEAKAISRVKVPSQHTKRHRIIRPGGIE